MQCSKSESGRSGSDSTPNNPTNPQTLGCSRTTERAQTFQTTHVKLQDSGLMSARARTCIGIGCAGPIGRRRECLTRVVQGRARRAHGLKTGYISIHFEHILGARCCNILFQGSSVQVESLIDAAFAAVKFGKRGQEEQQKDREAAGLDRGASSTCINTHCHLLSRR
ncbi:hypothetical protein BJV77DRAFT_184468 [Russula vinacea]|nr:hypothetical protein BJV77DRAFT_184468 [Russula vinacea]